MSTEPLTRVKEWQDEPELGRDADERPYPTSHIRSTANGELADRIRRALGEDDTTKTVWVQENTISGGYSEYTQIDDYTVTVKCGWLEKTFDIGYDGVIPALLKWLDKEAPVDVPSDDEAPEPKPAKRDINSITVSEYAALRAELDNHDLGRALWTLTNGDRAARKRAARLLTRAGVVL